MCRLSKRSKPCLIPKTELWRICFALLISLSLLTTATAKDRATQARERVLPDLQSALQAMDVGVGTAIFLRIFKEERELELWIAAGDQYRLFKRYPICSFSGRLGPKTQQGDLQAPEGFYSIGLSQLNPASRYHLSFNLGYPNAFERAQGWTGDYLMVHGQCVSIGCYAMGDAAIEEIYTLLEAALRGGQSRVSVHAFPFRMTLVNRKRHANSVHSDFWNGLAAGYDAFEASLLPPKIDVLRSGYRVTLQQANSGH